MKPFNARSRQVTGYAILARGLTPRMRQRLQSIERLGINLIPGGLDVGFLVVRSILSAATGITPMSFSAVALQAG